MLPPQCINLRQKKSWRFKISSYKMVKLMQTNENPVILSLVLEKSLITGASTVWLVRRNRFIHKIAHCVNNIIYLK